MIIGIDNITPGSSTGPTAFGGMRHFLQDLAIQLPGRFPEHQFKFFTPVWSDPLDLPPAANLKVVYCPGVPTGQVRRVLYEQLQLGKQIRSQNISTWLGTCNTLPLQWDGCSVLIVQSLQYFSQPEAFTWLRRLYLRAMVPISIRRAHRIVAFSQVAKDRIVRLFDALPSKIDVIHHGLRFSETAISTHSLRREKELVAQTLGSGHYILCVSAFYPYKNHTRLIEAFAQLKPEFPHKLALIGAETAAVPKVRLEALAKSHEVDRDVVFLGQIPDDQLAMFYRHAAVMVMPSLDETFGFPVPEAMLFGCPVVTSNLSSLPEVSGRAAVLVDPYSARSIADGVRLVLSDHRKREEMIREGRDRAKEFTKDRFFSKLANTIEISSAADSDLRRKTNDAATQS